MAARNEEKSLRDIPEFCTGKCLRLYSQTEEVSLARAASRGYFSAADIYHLSANSLRSLPDILAQAGIAINDDLAFRVGGDPPCSHPAVYVAACDAAPFLAMAICRPVGPDCIGSLVTASLSMPGRPFHQGSGLVISQEGFIAFTEREEMTASAPHWRLPLSSPFGEVFEEQAGPQAYRCGFEASVDGSVAIWAADSPLGVLYAADMQGEIEAGELDWLVKRQYPGLWRQLRISNA